MGPETKLGVRDLSSEWESAVPVKAHAREQHFVTPRQLADSNGMVEQGIQEIEVLLHTGALMTWKDLSGNQPVVFVFLKNECPCNAIFEPFFQRLEKHYHGRVRFYGVIDGDQNCASRYATDHRVPYPIVADAKMQFIRRIKVENGGYNVLVTAGGTIAGCFPSCSAESLLAMGKRIAQVAMVPEEPLEVGDMPGSLTTGCPFDRDR